MKNIFYTLILLLTISGELVHLAYMLSFDHDSIEMINDFKGENESEESKELGEEASDLTSSYFHLRIYFVNKNQISNKSLLFNDEQFCRVATPPPDYS